MTALRDQVCGQVLEPDDPGYAEACGGFQTAARHRPSIVAGATCAGDVAAAVAFAAAHGMPVAVQATGHGLATAATDGVLVSTVRLSSVDINPQARTARVEAGARSGAVIEAAAAHGLAPLNGSSPDVGTVGYTLGGGLPILGRTYGWAADHVRGIDVVTADGQQRHITNETDPDLFWALRGGRDNFGIATAITIDLVALTRLYGGGLYLPGDQAADHLATWRDWTATLPEQTTSSIAFIPLPDAPQLPAPIRGRHVTHIRVAHTGDAASGERLAAPLRALGTPLLDTLGELPYAQSAAIYAEPAAPMGYAGTNAMLDTLDADTASSLLELAGPGAPDPCVLEIRHLGGALARPAEIPNAVGHRDATYLVDALSRLTGLADHDRVRPLHDRIDAALAPRRIGHCLNFTYGTQPPERIRNAYGHTDHARLARLKATYDPDNTFRLNHNLPPQ